MTITASKLKQVLIVALGTSIMLYSCQKDKEVKDEGATDPSLDNIVFESPNGWPAPVYNFEDNKLSKEGFKLGRTLFFEPMLSSDNTVSCGSCHQPFAAFSQIGHNISHGVADRIGNRNSPAMFNLNWHNSFFWDGGVQHMEDQPKSPITNPLEMDESMENVIRKLGEQEHYRAMFKDAFGSEEITEQKIFKAMSQFMGLLVSSNSKYDKYVRNEQGGSFSQPELDGLNTFRSKCSSCHTEPLFSDFSLRNNGLSLVVGNNGLVDAGAGVITPSDSSVYYKFKVPSLRNLKYTSPYMHDGRFTTIDEVLQHYATGIQHTRNLDPLLSNGISLSAKEQHDLKAFLGTLDDERFVTDIRFKEPR